MQSTHVPSTRLTCLSASNISIMWWRGLASISEGLKNEDMCTCDGSYGPSKASFLLVWVRVNIPLMIGLLEALLKGPTRHQEHHRGLTWIPSSDDGQHLPECWLMFCRIVWLPPGPNAFGSVIFCCCLLSPVYGFLKCDFYPSSSSKPIPHSTSQLSQRPSFQASERKIIWTFFASFSCMKCWHNL